MNYGYQIAMAALEAMNQQAHAFVADQMARAVEDITHGLNCSDETVALSTSKPRLIPHGITSPVFKLAPMDFVQAVTNRYKNERWMTFASKEQKISAILAKHCSGTLTHGLQPELRNSPSLRRWFKVTRTDQYPDFVAPWLRAIFDNFVVDQFFVIQAGTTTNLGPHVDYLGTAVFYLILNGTKEIRLSPPTPENLRSLAQDDDPVFDDQRTWTVKAGDLVYLPPMWIHDVLNKEGGSVAYGVNVHCPAAKTMLQYVGMSDSHPLEVKSDMFSFLSRKGTELKFKNADEVRSAFVSLCNELKEVGR